MRADTLTGLTVGRGDAALGLVHRGAGDPALLDVGLGRREGIRQYWPNAPRIWRNTSKR
jgi:hypothetical protein